MKRYRRRLSWVVSKRKNGKKTTKKDEIKLPLRASVYKISNSEADALCKNFSFKQQEVGGKKEETSMYGGREMSQQSENERNHH